MPWAVKDLERHARDIDRIAVGKIAIRRHGAKAGDAEAGRLVGNALEQELVAMVRPDHRNGAVSQPLLQLGGAAGMVQMAMGEQNAVDRDPERRDPLQDPVNIAARVDHHAAPGLAVAEDGAVLLDRRDLDDRGGEFRHEPSVQLGRF
jgi:hypothetical protein